MEIRAAIEREVEGKVLCSNRRRFCHMTNKTSTTTRITFSSSRRIILQRIKNNCPTTPTFEGKNKRRRGLYRHPSQWLANRTTTYRIRMNVPRRHSQWISHFPRITTKARRLSPRSMVTPRPRLASNKTAYRRQQTKQPWTRKEATTFTTRWVIFLQRRIRQLAHPIHIRRQTPIWCSVI